MRRRASLLLAGLVSLAGTHAAQENRAWWVDLELEGPLSAVELDCGEDGRTQLLASLVRGERVSLAVPVPRRVPLGLEGLASAGLPAVVGEGAGSVSVSGWAGQPAARVAPLVRLLARPRPPVPGGGGALPGLAGLGLALACFLVALALRRRPLASLGAGVLGAAGLLGLAALLAREPDVRRALVLHEGEAWTPLGLVVRAGRDVLRLPAPAAPATVEVRPPGRALVFELELRDGSLTGVARAREAELYALELEPTVALEAGRNAFAPLARVWLRSAGGAWESRGAWPLDAPLPPVPSVPSDQEPEAPPGWLSAGLPPGRPVLVGLTQAEDGRAEEAWVRLLGFRERD